MTEVRQLATTVDRLWPEVAAFIPTGHSNAKSEGINRVIKAHRPQRVRLPQPRQPTPTHTLRHHPPSPRTPPHRSTLKTRHCTSHKERVEGPWHHVCQGPEGTATPSTGPDTAPAFCVCTGSRGMRACAGIAVARPEITSLSMSCGTRAQHVRPGDPDGARLLRSFPLGSNCSTAYCWYCEPLGDLSQRHSLAVSPVARPATAPAENPTAELPSARARSRRLHRGTAHRLHCWSCLTGTATASTAALLVVAPDSLRATRSGGQPRRRPATTLASKLHHRTALRPAARQFVSAGPLLSLWATRETIARRSPKVYSSQHRFPVVRSLGNRPRTATTG
ncbi:hypothetical protein ACGFWD_38350 [Streptomyces sp. NPDC048448]|uniref:hypothetical protein n=1 Tax=Streptomyces sp. NPDC048448 TaxID=3365554 RepID=UPI0037191327